MRSIERSALLVFTALMLARPIGSATIVVTGDCTLAAAINAANNDDDSGGLCPPGGSGADVLEMTADATLTAIVSNRTGLPGISSDITIHGHGLKVERAPGSEAFRLFRVVEGGSLKLEDLTVTGGVFEGGSGGFFEGAGIKNQGELILTNTTVSGNGNDPGLGYGGAIWTSGSSTTTLRSSTLTDNIAYWGAGIYNFGELHVYDSTLSDHFAFKYGAALLNRGTAAFTNSTLAENDALQDNGIRNQGALFLVNSTLSPTAALNNDGFYAATTYLYNTIVWSCLSDSTLVDGGNNFSTNATCPGADFTPGVDIEESLADNGGATRTLALLPGSVIADAAGECGLAADQRGYLREGPCDSGAFELDALPPPSIDVRGTCPGSMTVVVTDATPSSEVLLFKGAGAGESTVPGGACAGTDLDITNPNPLGSALTDGDGVGGLQLTFFAPDCGRVVQAVDRSGCRPSNVAVIDSCQALTRAHTGDGSHPVTTPSSSAGCAFGEFAPGEAISLTATPSRGWAVSGWSGTDNDGSTDTMNSLSMPSAPTEVSVSYVQACFPLALGKTGQGGLPLASPANSPGCPIGEYSPGEVIDLTAVPDVGWGVGGWSGTDDDASTELTNTVTMPAGAHAASVDYVEQCYSLALAHTGDGADPVAFPLGDEGFWIEHEIRTDFDGANSAVATDLDLDGDLDILSSAEDAGEILWWANGGDGSAWTEHLIASPFGDPQSPVAADVDGDGDLDLAAGSGQGNQVAWFENTNGSGSAWTKHVVATDFRRADSVFVTDIDGDLDLDVLGAAKNTGTISWFENTAGDGSAWTEHVITSDKRPYNTVLAADLDGDLDLDVATAEDGDDVIWFENTAGDASAWSPTTIGTLDLPRSLEATDLDADGDLDLLGTAFFGDDVSWFENSNGDASVWLRHDIVNLIDATWAESFDVDRDGDLDVLAVRGQASTAELRWLENRLDEGLSWIFHFISSEFDWARVLTAGDVDGDSDVDAIAARATDQGVGGAIAWFENAPDDGCSAGTFNFGDRIRLDAAPDPGWEVGSWSGTDDDTSTEPMNELTMPAADHTVAVNYLESGPQGPTIALSGSCPGLITIDVATSDPNVDVILYAGSGPGSTILPSGGCAGTDLDLDQARRIEGVTTDGSGRGQIIRNFAAPWCARFLQAIDRACATGNVEQIP